jgi:hypothetical protein
MSDFPRCLHCGRPTSGLFPFCSAPCREKGTIEVEQ